MSRPPKRSRIRIYAIIGSVAFLVIFCCICPLTYALTTETMRSIGLLPTLTPTHTPTHTATPGPTDTPEPTKTPKPTNTPKPCIAFHLGTHGFTCDIPSNLVMTVGDTLTTSISDLTVDVTLSSFKETKLERWGSHKNRYFETEFLIHTRGDKTVVFTPKTVFLAANDGGYRYSRGGGVDLITSGPVTIEANSEALVVLEWRTDAYNTTGGKTSDQTIWITVNTPISEGIDVPLDVVSVFRIYFPESD